MSQFSNPFPQLPGFPSSEGGYLRHPNSELMQKKEQEQGGGGGGRGGGGNKAFSLQGRIDELVNECSQYHANSPQQMHCKDRLGQLLNTQDDMKKLAPRPPQPSDSFKPSPLIGASTQDAAVPTGSTSLGAPTPAPTPSPSPSPTTNNNPAFGSATAPVASPAPAVKPTPAAGGYSTEAVNNLIQLTEALSQTGRYDPQRYYLSQAIASIHAQEKMKADEAANAQREAEAKARQEKEEARKERIRLADEAHAVWRDARRTPMERLFRSMQAAQRKGEEFVPTPQEQKLLDAMDNQPETPDASRLAGWAKGDRERETAAGVMKDLAPGLKILNDAAENTITKARHLKATSSNKAPPFNALSPETPAKPQTSRPAAAPQPKSTPTSAELQQEDAILESLRQLLSPTKKPQANKEPASPPPSPVELAATIQTLFPQEYKKRQQAAAKNVPKRPTGPSPRAHPTHP